MNSSNVDAAREMSEPPANPLTDWHPGRVIRITWLVTVGGIVALALALIAKLLAGTIVGLPAAFRALNAIPAAAWLERRTGTGDELDWHHHC